MKGFVRARAVVMGAAAVSLLVVPLATPASALTPSATCSKLTGSTTIKGTNATTKSTLATCKPAGLAAGGSSSVTTPAKNLFGKITSTLTWNGGKGTTTMVEQYKTAAAGSKSKCAKGLSHELLTGTTKSSTGAAAKIIKAGEPISASVCTNTSKQPYVSTLEPGTTFKL